ncbi:MAG: hypothetical protein GY749_31105 [Desulfobacteraceae bacterium]|nr:hypothetical protein [Desulfobacteraceae bacterium]
MEKTKLEQISETIQSISAIKFTFYIDRYVKTSAKMDSSLGKPDTKIQANYDNSREAVLQEASAILSQSKLSLSYIANLQFKMNGQPKGISKTDEKTRIYFAKIRKHQIELLSSISDEAEITSNIIKQSVRMRDVIKQNSPMIYRASNLMDILRERISERPTTLLRVNSNDEKAGELNRIFHSINKYEDNYEAGLRQESEKHPAENMLAVYYDLMQGLREDIEQRKLKIADGVKELNQGWKLLKKLATKGYSRRMQRVLDKLVDKHNARTDRFLKSVQECRLSFYL